MDKRLTAGRLAVFISVAVILTSFSTPSSAFWWMGYHKPAFNGRAIDAETKEPIEGAVVVAVYDKDYYAIIESNSAVIDVRETLTDKNGYFHIPFYTTIVQPLSWEGLATFIIYKPGYGSYPNYRIKPPMDMPSSILEEFFSRESVGTAGELRWSTGRAEIIFGVVELPRLKTREERLRASHAGPRGEKYLWKKQPMLIKALRDEYQYLWNEDPGDLYIKFIQ